MGRTEGEGGEEGVCETREVWETIQSEVRDSSWLLHPFTYRASSSRRTKPHRPMLAILRYVDKGYQSWTKVPARVAHRVRGPKRRASKFKIWGIDLVLRLMKGKAKMPTSYILPTYSEGAENRLFFIRQPVMLILVLGFFAACCDST